MKNCSQMGTCVSLNVMPRATISYSVRQAVVILPFDFCALAFERHGYMAKETAALIRKLATLKANAFELDPSEEIRKWYTVLSCCVQRANAKVLRGDATPGQRSSVPPRLRSQEAAGRTTRQTAESAFRGT